MFNYTFLNPEYFYLLLALAPMVGWYVWKQNTAKASLQISSLRFFSNVNKSRKLALRHLPFIFRCLAIISLIIVLARPQSTNQVRNIVAESIDIVISLDVSTSMLAMDFEPNRLEVAKDFAIEFIKGRPHDRIGLVLFAGQSFTQCPLTLNHQALINLVRESRTGMMEDGTAIGMGLATAVNRLKDSDAKSKVIILISDGVNNRGQITPLTAAEIARAYGIKVYTVGVGSVGVAPFPIGQHIESMEVRIDEEIMQQISEMTGGQYFRATDEESLRRIYQEIDELEKHQIEVQEYVRFHEEFLPFAILALLFILMEIIVRNTILRTQP